MHDQSCTNMFLLVNKCPKPHSAVLATRARPKQNITNRIFRTHLCIVKENKQIISLGMEWNTYMCICGRVIICGATMRTSINLFVCMLVCLQGKSKFQNTMLKLNTLILNPLCVCVCNNYSNVAKSIDISMRYTEKPPNCIVIPSHDLLPSKSICNKSQQWPQVLGYYSPLQLCMDCANVLNFNCTITQLCCEINFIPDRNWLLLKAEPFWGVCQ